MAVDAWCECNNSPRVRRARTQNMFKLVNLVFVCALLAGRAHCVHADDTDCNTVKQSLQTLGLNNTELLSEPENADSLGVCVISGKTCCSVKSEEILADYSREQFEKTVEESLVNVSSSFNAESQEVDNFFHKLIADSQRDLDEMFNKMFGMIYLKNKFLFTNMYEGFENYYNKDQINLSETTDTFYRMLSQRIFSDLNPHFIIDDKYLTCAADQMKDLNPFGDVPNKLNANIKRSFVATKTLSKALRVGADVAKNMLSIKPTQECVKSLLRMQHCSSCAGVEAKACPNYCINVMKGCLAYHSSLENEWNNYVEAIDKILDKLLGSFNIVIPVELIGITIADGIITYQEKWYDISQKVFTNCGIPTLGRQRRSTSLPSPYNFHHTRITRDVNKEQSFKNLIQSIKHVVNERKNFWSNLPNHICNTDNMAEEPTKKCWNGTSVNEYLPAVVDDSLTNQKENSDILVDKNSHIPNEQISALKAIIIKLQNAHEGMDVDWIDYKISTTSQPTTVTEKHLPLEATENVFPDKRNATEN